MIPAYEDDENLIQRLKSGDDKALDHLFKTCYRELFNLFVRLVDDPEAARDIIQDVFAKLWEKRQSLHLKNMALLIIKKRLTGEITSKEDKQLIQWL